MEPSARLESDEERSLSPYRGISTHLCRSVLLVFRDTLTEMTTRKNKKELKLKLESSAMSVA